MYKAFFDGGLRLNVMNAGFVVYSPDNKKIHEYGTKLSEHNGTVNIAEYKALQLLLQYLIDNNIKDVEVFGDCQTIIYQINGKNYVNAKHLQDEHAKVVTMMNKFDKITISWIPREKNTEADRIAR